MGGLPGDETLFFCPVSSPPILLPNCRDHNFTMLSTNNLSYKDAFQLVEFHSSSDLTGADSPPPLTTTTNDEVVAVHHAIIIHPTKMDMVYWIFAAVLFIYVRRFLERNILLPLGRQLGVKGNSQVAHLDLPSSSSSSSDSTETVLKLEQAYSSSSPNSLSHKQVQSLSNETGLECRVIERWLRRRAAADKKPSDLIKFVESGWRLIWYISSTSFGLVVMWDQPWLWDITQIWKDYPYHGIPNEMRWYYCFGAGQYLSQLITLTSGSDVRRKDFWEMVVHHVVTISLMATSWSYTYTRIGSYVLLLHDVGDIFLEGSKVAKYSKRNNLAAGIFVVFALVWVATRLLIYPHQVIYRCLECGYVTGALSLYGLAFFLVLLLSLFGLHLFWTYFIIKIVQSVISSVENAKDSRSASEGEESRSEAEEEIEQETATFKKNN